MAISYPLAQPSEIGMSQVLFRMVNAKTISQSPFTGKQQQYVWPKQQWEVEITIPPVKREDGAEAWITFLAKLQAGTSIDFPSFYLSDPNGYPIGNQSTNFQVERIDPNTVELTGMQTGVTKAIAQGDYIRIGEGSAARYHKVLDQVDSDAGGVAQASIWPSTNIVGIVQGSLQDAYGVFTLDNNSPEFSINDISSYGLSFTARSLV